MLSKKTTIQAKGVAALFIMIGHLLPGETSGIVRFFFYGPVWVGLFFFFSGYGLQKKAVSKEGIPDNYVIHIIKRVWIPFAIAEIIHLFTLHIVSDWELSIRNLLGCMVGAPLSNSILWYVVELLILEIVFLIINKTPIAKNKGLYTGFWLAVYLTFLATSVIFDVGTWWYISTITYILGIFFSRDEDLFGMLTRKPVQISVTTLAALLYVLERVADIYDIGIHRYINIPLNYYLTGLTLILVPVFTMAIISHLIENVRDIKPLMFLGKISYYIYLYHVTAKLWISWIWGK